MSSHVLTLGVTKAIRDLYSIFARYKSRHPQGCPCCVSDADKYRLLSRPLGELTVDDVQRYSWKALTTWGTVEDFKHFLPRLLELMVIDECSAIEPAVLLGKLRLAAWQTWPDSERKGVDRYLEAVWEDCLTAETGSVWVDELLCGLAHVVDDLQPYLTVWMNCRIKTGYAHLLNFIEWNSAIILKRKHLQNSFWSDAGQQMSHVVTWLLNPQTMSALEKIFDTASDQSFANELAVVIDRISGLQQSFRVNRA
jgi:hypothetical protein